MLFQNMVNSEQKYFASDNNSSVHPKIMDALLAANHGHVIAYGDDPYTSEAVEKFRSVFGRDTEVFFVCNGTGANTSAIAALTRSYNAVLCSDTAHIHVDECGAPEKFAGCKLLPLPSHFGKIRPEQIKKHLHSLGFEHHSQPGMLSITQATEWGTLYNREELAGLCRYAHDHDLPVHMDGARIANASAALGSGLAEMTRGAGVDVLSFGGTKNGMMFGEAVVFFRPELAENYKYHRKQSTQLLSKMRYVSAQFSAILENDLWLKNAVHANSMARLLYDLVKEIPEVKMDVPLETNALFPILPRETITPLQKKSFFYIWDETEARVRWMTSFDTTEDNVKTFVEDLKKILYESSLH
jgi:threonine aldolase